MHRSLSGPALALLIAAGGLAEPALGIAVAELTLTQSATQVGAAMDETAAEMLFEQAKKLLEAGDLKGAAKLYVRGLAWSEQSNGREHPDTGAILFRLGSLYADLGACRA